jgi:hypothetical protein
MEKLTSLGLNFDRVLIQLIIPGMVAVFPYFIIYLDNFAEDKNFLLKNPTILVTALTILSLIVGIILENIGSTIEVKWYDKKNEKKFTDYIGTWEKFLKLNYEGNEPNGHRYLRNILLRMKFELSFGVALMPFAVGLIILDQQHLLISSFKLKIFMLYILPIVGSLYLIIKEAYASSVVLAKTRKLLVEKFYID